MKLNTFTEWDQIVNENHRRSVSAEFDREIAGVSRMIREDISGKDREEITMKLRANRPGKLAKLAMIFCVSAIVVAGIVNLEIVATGDLMLKPVIGLAGLILGIITGACLGKRKH